MFRNEKIYKHYNEAPLFFKGALYFVRFINNLRRKTLGSRYKKIVLEAVLREALLNALCHKQYQFGMPIQISVYTERVLLIRALLGDALNEKKESCQSLWLTRFSLFYECLFYGHLFSVMAFNSHFSAGISHFRHSRKRKAMYK